MTLDKERLRVLAEAALSAQASSDCMTHAAEFEAAMTPDVVLTLLSENAALAAEVERLRKDAGRWKQALMHIGAANHLYGQHFTINGLPLDSHINLMRGGVAGHFETAIDAILADKGGAES